MVLKGIETLRAYRTAAGQTRKFWCTRLPAPSDLAAEEFRALEARVQQKLNAGELRQDDPDYIRYCELKAAVRRPGPEGYAQDIIKSEPEPHTPAPTRARAPVSRRTAQPPPARDVWAAEEGDPFAEED